MPLDEKAFPDEKSRRGGSFNKVGIEVSLLQLHMITVDAAPLKKVQLIGSYIS